MSSLYMFNLIERYQRHRSIKKYIRSLGSSLKKRYGVNEYYTEGQIRTTLEVHKIGGKYASYAYGLYLAPKNLSGILERLNESRTSKNMRIYLATNYIGGTIDYSSIDILLITGNASKSSNDIDGGSFDGADGGD